MSQTDEQTAGSAPTVIVLPNNKPVLAFLLLAHGIRAMPLAAMKDVTAEAEFRKGLTSPSEHAKADALSEALEAALRMAAAVQRHFDLVQADRARQNGSLQ